MNESDKWEGLQQGTGRENEINVDPYMSDSSRDIYTTPEVMETAVVVEETEPAAVVADTHGLFSGNQADSQIPYGSQNGNYGAQSPYGNQNSGGAYGMQPPCGNQNGAYGVQTSYGNQEQTGSYGAQSSYGNQNPGGVYGAQPPYGNQNQSGGYGAQPPYGNQNQSGGYGAQPPYGNQNQSGGYGAQPSYGNQNQSGVYDAQSPYGSRQAGGGYGGQPPFGGQPPYDPYSPYAMPKKQNTGLIVGIVIGIIVLFLVAVFALASRAVNMLSEKEKQDIRREVYDFNDDSDFNYHDRNDDYDFDYDDDSYDDYFNYDDFYDGDYYEDAEYDDRYYNLHDEIRSDLSYQVEVEEFEYESEYENVIVIASIPVISGENVPNLDKINKAIRAEVDDMTTLFEEEYESHIKESEENYFMASLLGYVTYMDEDKLSIAYQEEMYNDRTGGVYLRSINIDMKNGVVLDNADILAVDDDFSVEFRQKSDEQNGEISYLTYMTDQQITDYFKSDDIIVFYTPKGMEIGFNYEEGWVTVTYEEYEKYLKVF